MARIKQFIASWLYYPKMVGYFKGKPYYDCIKKFGRFRYAKFMSTGSDMKRVATTLHSVNEWKTCYNEEPVTK